MHTKQPIIIIAITIIIIMKTTKICIYMNKIEVRLVNQWVGYLVT